MPIYREIIILKSKQLTSISSEAQEAQMRRLNKALHKRQNAEIDIWKQLNALEKSRRALAKILIEVCHARLETTAEISTTGRVPEKALKLVCKRVILYRYDNADNQSSDRDCPRKLPTEYPTLLYCYTNFAVLKICILGNVRKIYTYRRAL